MLLSLLPLRMTNLVGILTALHTWPRWYGYSFGGPGQENPTILTQCVTEQKWMRESMLRSLMYLQVTPCLPLPPPTPEGGLHVDARVWLAF